MTDTPPFDPPYFSVEKTAQGVRVIETRADGSRQERMVPMEDAAGLLVDVPDAAPAAVGGMGSTPKKGARSPSGLPPGATLLAVPFAQKDAAKKLGARWSADRRAWYVPAGIDVSLFSRWRSDDTGS